MSPTRVVLPDPISLHNLGVQLREQGQLREARDAFLQASDSFKMVHGVESFDTRVYEARAVLAAAGVCGEMGDIADGHKLALDAIQVLLPVFEQSPLPNWPLMQEACGYYIDYCDKLGVVEDKALMKRVEDVVNGRR